MRERDVMNVPALVVAIAGPVAGIAIWYVIDVATGRPGLALGLGAAVIYVSGRATRALAMGREPGVQEPAAIVLATAVTLVVVGVPYALLVLVGVPAIVALPIGIILGPPFHPAVERFLTSLRDGRVGDREVGHAPVRPAGTPR